MKLVQEIGMPNLEVVFADADAHVILRRYPFALTAEEEARQAADWAMLKRIEKVENAGNTRLWC